MTTARRWSPDGRQIAFASRPEGNTDVYVVSALGGPLRRLTRDPSEDHSAHWSRDGKWIYFCSHRTGRHQVWKTRSNGSGEAAQVTRNGGWSCRESPDGALLYYTTFDEPGVWRMPRGAGRRLA